MKKQNSQQNRKNWQKFKRIALFCCLTVFAAVLLESLGFASPFTSQINQIYAATATHSATVASPSPTPSASPDTAIQLKARIDTVLKNRADQVKGVVDDLTQKKRGFIGEIQRVIENTVTVKNAKGVETLSITPNIVVVKDGKKATVDDLAVGDWVIALGYGDAQNFTLKRLVVSSNTLMPHTFDTLLATVQSITKTQVTVMPRNAQSSATYTLNKNTKYEDSTGAATKRESVQTDTQYLVIGYTDDSGNKIATVIRALSDSIAPSPSPSPTAKPKTATAPGTNPSATPKANSTP